MATETTLQAYKANGSHFVVDPASHRTYAFGPTPVAAFHVAEAALTETRESLDAIVADAEGRADADVTTDELTYGLVTSGERLPAKKPNRDAYAVAAAESFGFPIELVYAQLNPAESDEWDHDGEDA